MSVRVKLILLGVLLCLALIGAVIATIATVQAFQRFQQIHRMVLAGDVRAIQPWMTLHHISIVYHVPENDLYQALKIPRPSTERLSLQLLAGRYNRPVNELIHEVQVAILTYRREHPRQGFHPPSLGYQTIRPFIAVRENQYIDFGHVATLSDFNRNEYMNDFMVSS